MNTTKRKYESPRQLARQASILKTTREMLSEVGYHATTIRGLAKKAGVAPGTLYNLYNSKDELVLAAVEDLLSDIFTEANKGSEPGLARILTQGQKLSEATVANPEYAEAMTRALFGVEPDDPLTETLYARGIPEIERQLEVAMETGEIRPDVDVANTAMQLQSHAWGIIMAWLMGVVPLDELIRESMRARLVILVQIAAETSREDLEKQLDEL